MNENSQIKTQTRKLRDFTPGLSRERETYPGAMCAQGHVGRTEAHFSKARHLRSSFSLSILLRHVIFFLRVVTCFACTSSERLGEQSMDKMVQWRRSKRQRRFWRNWLRSSVRRCFARAGCPMCQSQRWRVIKPDRSSFWTSMRCSRIYLLE